MLEQAFELALAAVEKGEHIIPALNQSFFKAYRKAPQEERVDPRTGEVHLVWLYNEEAPEAVTVALLWEQENGVKGTDFFLKYTPEQNVRALEKLRDFIKGL
jgi:hypothetical protein